ncbi:MAG: hypothetical protein IPH18_06800 [Chitinophagaceae bacterium]|nr:hypothetical protein [Chitinophagaceae bacterium]
MNKKVAALVAGFCILSMSGFTQLLTWTADFPKDNDNITITLDATKGNQALNNYTPVSDVYVHIGVITNLSTSNTDWRYSKFTWLQHPQQPRPHL